MHLDEERVQRFLHGELAPSLEHSVREHLAGCAECVGRVAEARRDEGEIHALLRSLDHPPPEITADLVAVRAVAHRSGWGRWAAGILLALGLAGAAYATPGSPVRGWLRGVVQWVRGRPVPVPVAPIREDRGGAGIAVSAGSKLVIVFTSPQTVGQAEVLLTDGAEVVVRALGGVATFSSEVDRLVIGNQGSSATFQIQIPRAAPRIEIRVEGTRIFLKEGPRVSTETSTDTIGPYLLPLTP